MPIGNNSKVIQVIVSKPLYNFIKKYSDIFGVSISEFCKNAISKEVYNSYCKDIVVEDKSYMEVQK